MPTGVQRERKGCPDRRETEAMAAAAEAEAAKIRAGLIDPKAVAYRAHEARPLADHLADFQAALLAKGGTRKHALVTRNRAGRVLTWPGPGASPTCRSPRPWTPWPPSEPRGSGPRRSTTTSGPSRRSRGGSGGTAEPGSITWPTWRRATPRPTAAAAAAP